MRRNRIAIAIASVLSVSFPAAAADVRQHVRVLSFGTMFGVDGAFVGDANPICGIPGDELPWEIAKSIKGELDINGRLRIKVKGLVFKDVPQVPPELRGKNDETDFRGLVCCTTEESGNVVVTNVITDGFPSTVEGDSTIDTIVQLPSPCVAPNVMVLAGSEDKWFAMTGFEQEE